MKNDFEIASPLVLLKADALFLTKLTRKLTTGNSNIIMNARLNAAAAGRAHAGACGGEAAIKERARREGDTSDFAEDSVFSFPSTAADGVLGCSANGAVSRKMSR